MTQATAPRAKLVEQLWQLKAAFEQAQDGRSIHFDTLLRDSDYRRELINEAAMSRHREMRDLGRSLRVINTDGELRASQHSRKPVNPDIAEMMDWQSQQPAEEALRSRRWWLWLLLPALLLAVSLWWVLGRGHEQFVSGSLHGDHVWTADKTWILDDIVYVEAAATLTIEPGAVVLGRPGSALVVTRDGQIMARGRADAPIVFTSAQPEGARKAGDWGGLVLLGNAPVNTLDAQVEGVPTSDTRGMFGGVDSRDNCGVLEFVRVEFAGYEVYANNELNGLTLGGCGSNTIVRHVQVHRASDDGIEIFGGTVDMKHILISGAADDSLDWDMGWRGRVQFLQVLQYPGVGDNAIEADNRNGREDAQPISEPQFYNVTLLSLNSDDKYQRAMTLRRGTGGHFHNMIISGFSGEAIDIKGRVSASRLSTGMMSFGGLLLYNNGRDGRSHFIEELGKQDDDGGFDEAAYFASLARRDISPEFSVPVDPVRLPDFRVGSKSPAGQGAVAVPEGEFWDQGANYLGAVRPGSASTWMNGWTAFAPN